MRLSIITASLFWALGLSAQDVQFADNKIVPADIDTVVDRTSEKYVSWWAFDTTLIPCDHLYDHSWDSLNVDLPRLNSVDSTEGINLVLVDEDCGYHHPCPGEINSDYGWRRYRMHKGVDIDLETGDPIYAAFDGVVRISKYNYGGFGHYVLIRHYNGLETLYGHLSERMVQPNQTVRAGEVIGLGGSTGRSTGPHLHFEVRYKGLPINPNAIIEFDSNELKVDSLSLTVADFKAVNVPRYQSSYYRVRSGDTLWGISRRYGTSVSRLCRINGISSKSTLRVGQRLRVR